MTLSRSSKQQTDTTNIKFCENASYLFLRFSRKLFVSILLECFQTFWTHCILYVEKYLNIFSSPIFLGLFLNLLFLNNFPKQELNFIIALFFALYTITNQIVIYSRVREVNFPARWRSRFSKIS
jgi:hypothetical protein